MWRETYIISPYKGHGGRERRGNERGRKRREWAETVQRRHVHPKGGLQIINVSRKKLALDQPVLLPCIYLLPAQAHEVPGPLCTDGDTLFFHPKTVVDDYLARRTALCDQMLHVIVHGLPGHFPKREGQVEPLFDAAADVKATDFMARLGRGYTHPQLSGRSQAAVLRLREGERRYRPGDRPRLGGFFRYAPHDGGAGL